MGDRREQLVAVGDVRVSSKEVRAWLRSRGWAAPAAGISDFLCADSPADVLMVPERSHTQVDTVTVVDAVGDERVWVAGEGTAAAVCQRCGTLLDETASDAALSQWCGGGAEPLATCRQCGWSALLGDWNLEASIAVGSPAIVIDAYGAQEDPAALARRLRTQLVEGVGGRWAYVHLEL